MYDIGPTPEFHYDIEGLEEYYILPERNNFFVALVEDKIVATAAIRAYDRDYEEWYESIESAEWAVETWLSNALHFNFTDDEKDNRKSGK